jgi:aminoglycoside 2''-phosphotransferase
VDLLDHIRSIYPDLAITTTRKLDAGSQFNDILVLNEALVFRFPRYEHVARALPAEIAVLDAIGSRVPLPVPQVIYRNLDPAIGAVFSGYPLLPGEPLWRADFDAIADQNAIRSIAVQLGSFLHALHTIPRSVLPRNLPTRGSRDDWTDLYERIKAQLFPYMRPDAQEQVRDHWEPYLADERNWRFPLVLRHGDFGTGNLLHDPHTLTITGVIDWSFAAWGDAALDIAALDGSYGSDFVRLLAPHYPNLDALLHRAHFYIGTFALQEALSGLEDNDHEAFESGIEEYR